MNRLIFLIAAVATFGWIVLTLAASDDDGAETLVGQRNQTIIIGLR